MSSIQYIVPENSNVDASSESSSGTSWIKEKIVTSKIDSDNDGTIDSSNSETWTYDAQGNTLEYISSQDTDGDGSANRIDTETWAYDDNGNQTSYNYIEDDGADGNSDRIESETWTYDENGNQTAYIYLLDSDGDDLIDSRKQITNEIIYDENGKKISEIEQSDNNGDGESDRIKSKTWTYDVDGNQTAYTQTEVNANTIETRAYDSYGSLIQYILDSNGDGQNDHVANFFASYNAQGKLTEYGLSNWLGDVYYDWQGVFHGRTYDSNNNLRSLWVDYDLNGQEDLVINYDSTGKVTSDLTNSGLYSDFFLFTPIPLEFGVYDSTGKVFEATSSLETWRSFMDFKGYVNDTLVLDTYVNHNTYEGLLDFKFLSDLEGKTIYRHESLSGGYLSHDYTDTYTYTYNAEGEVISSQNSYQYIEESEYEEHIFYGYSWEETSGTETVNYDTEGRIISEIDEGERHSLTIISHGYGGELGEDTYEFDGSSFKSESTFSYDEHEDEDSTTITETYLKDYNGDGNFNYKEITEETLIYATEEHNFDIDGDGQCSASVDGLLFYGYLNVRNLPSFLRDNLTQQLADDLINPDGDATGKTGAEIAEYLESNLEMMDIDGNGQIEAGIDGLLLYGYLNIHSLPSLLRDNLTQQLANNLIPEDSDAIRTLGGDISNFIESYMV